MKTAKSLTLYGAGFCAFITIEVLFRGYSYPVSGVMGGFAVIMLDGINDEMSWDLDLVLQALIGGILITLMEASVGIIMLCVPWIPRMWDYSDIPFNIAGIICLPFSIAWVFLSVLAIFLADAINYYVFEETEVPHYTLFGKIKFSFERKRCDGR